MADTKISALAQLTVTPDALDEFVVVDKSDTSMAASGTDKRIQFKDLGLAWVLAASGAAVTAPANTSENTLATITVPANALGANGSLRIFAVWSFTGSTNSKTAKIRYSGGAGSAFVDLSTTGATNIGLGCMVQIHNRNATNSQIGGGPPGNTSGFGFQTVAAVTAAVDTTASTTIVITGQKATAGETLTLERYVVEVLPAD